MDTSITEAEVLWWKGDAAGAVARLSALADQAGFLPRGAVVLAYALRAAGDGQAAVDWAAKVVAAFPDDLAAWEILLFDAMAREFPYGQSVRRGLDPDLPVVAGFLAALRRADRIDREGLARPLALVLLLTHPDQSEDILDRAAAILTPDQQRLLRRATGFLRRLAALPRPDTWSIDICGTEEALIREGAHGIVDLSWFRGMTEAGWTVELVRAFALALSRLMDPARFDDRAAGMTSGPALSPEDHLPALMLIPTIETPRLWRGEDADVRVARRPMRFDAGDLVLRAGRVELWALNHWLQDRDAACAVARQAALEAEEAIAMGRDYGDTSTIWPRCDALWDLTYLSTNTGWYARPDTAAACFDDWCARYAAALQAGDLMVECAEVLTRLATHTPALRARPLHDWSDQAFLAGLRGRRVVLATPFWQEIATLWQSGRLHALWRAAGVDLVPADLVTLPAPVSIWPHRPDRDWSASFDHLATASRAAIAQIGAEVFIASCGCYGLPLVHEMHRSHAGLSGLYFGHAIHGWFGILTNDALHHPLYRRAADPALWCKADLNRRFAGMDRIDDGRYVIETED